MIICSRQEENGLTRKFLIEQERGLEVWVKTHTDDEEEWCDAGILTRARHGIEVSVPNPIVRGQFVKLDRTFRNEIAALQALAVSYQHN